MKGSIALALAELEDSPQDTDTMDMERILLATGHERLQDDSGLVVFVHREWGTYWNFDPTRRVVPVGYVLAIVRRLRAQMGL